MERIEIDTKILRYDIAKIIIENDENTIEAHKVYALDLDYFETINEWLERAGVKIRKNDLVTIILENSLDGIIYQYGNYGDSGWYKIGDVIGYA